MARTYDDIYITSNSGKLHLHLDGPSGINESVPNPGYSAVAAYFKVGFTFSDIIYPSGYSGNGCDEWVRYIQYEFTDQITLSNNEDLDLTVDFNDSDAYIFGYYDDTSSTYAGQIMSTGGHSDCFENNWWKDGLRVQQNGTAFVKLYYYDSDDNILQHPSTVVTVGTNHLTYRTSSDAWIYNAPPSVSTRAIITDDNTSRGSTPYGVDPEPLQSLYTGSSASGDPHVTTFDGHKYTL